MTQPAGLPTGWTTEQLAVMRNAHQGCARLADKGFCGECAWFATLDALQAPAMLVLLRRLTALPLGPGVHLRELKEDTEALLATFDGGGGIQPAADRP